MEEVSGSIIYLLGISKQVCLSSPPLHSWQFHGVSYMCLGSFHPHRPEEQSSPNPKFSFFNSIYLSYTSTKLSIHYSSAIGPTSSLYPQHFSFLLIITNMSGSQVMYSSSKMVRNFEHVWRMHLRFLQCCCKGLTYGGGEETIGHNGYDSWLWKKRLGSNPIPSLTSQERQITGEVQLETQSHLPGGSSNFAAS